MKKLSALLLALFFLSPFTGFAKNHPSWQEWAPKIQFQNSDLSQFRSHLPKQGQAAWDNASDATKSVALLLVMGMQQAYGNQFREDAYYSAFKIANKAEAGFHLDKAIDVLSLKYSQ